MSAPTTSQKRDMLLAIDIGNTNIVLGIFSGEEIVYNWRLETNARKTEDEYGLLMHQLLSLAKVDHQDIGHGILSSVVPPKTAVLENMFKRYFGLCPLLVNSKTKTDMPILYDHPEEVGADRIVNAVAAYKRFRQGVIIVDFGTATTFDIVTDQGAYLGGCIAPGIRISSEALFRYASKLQRVEFVRPPSVIGKNTIHSIQAGLVFGYAGLVDEIVNRMREEVDYPTQVVATGGLADLIASESKAIEVVDHDLTLRGLYQIFQLNNQSEYQATG